MTGIKIIIVKEAEISEELEQLLQDKTVHTIVARKEATENSPVSLRILQKRFDLAMREYTDPYTFKKSMELTDIIDLTFIYRGKSSTKEVLMQIKEQS